MNQFPQLNAFRKAITRNEKQIKRSRNKLLSIHQKSTIRIVNARQQAHMAKEAMMSIILSQSCVMVQKNLTRQNEMNILA